MAEETPRETRIDARIDARYGSLPPQERRVADFLLEHLGDLAIFSAADISRETGVSKATVSRLFRKLDFDDFKEVRDHARALRHRGLPTASPVITGDSEDSSGVARHEVKEQENLSRLVALLGDGRLTDAMGRIAAAERVVIVGLRNSYPVALHLHQQLIQARDQVRVAPQPGQTLGEEVAGLVDHRPHPFRLVPDRCDGVGSPSGHDSSPDLSTTVSKRYAEARDGRRAARAGRSVWEIPPDLKNCEDAHANGHRPRVTSRPVGARCGRVTARSTLVTQCARRRARTAAPGVV